MRAWLQLVRLPAVFSVWSNILAAHMIATGGSPVWRVLSVQLAITTAIYWGGMVLNDCFDLHEDERERPGRPLPSRRISIRAAWALGFGLVGLGVLLGIAAGGRILWLTLPLAAAVLAYDAGLKHSAVGPALMGLCRYLNWLMGLAVARIGLADAALASPILLYTTSLTILSRTETSITARAPIRNAVILSTLAVLAVVALHVSGVQTQPGALILLAALTVFVSRHLRLAYRAPTPDRVQASVKAMLLGMMPLDAVLSLGQGRWATAVVVLALLFPARVLARRLYIT